MSCCGQKREELRQRRTVFVATASPAPVESAGPRTPVVFKGTGSYLVTGPATGEVYCFSSQQPEQWIDPRDAVALIRTRFFAAKSAV
jgi:hypothetical protein